MADFGPFGAEVVLEVANGALSDLQLYLVRGSTFIRIGNVSGLSARTFGITGAQLGSGGELILVARTRSNVDARRSPVFTAVAGQRIMWTINVHPSTDTVVIR